MGVTGLLPFVKTASEPCSAARLRELGVDTIAADAYCWLHRAAAAAATPLTIPGQCDAHVRYCLKYVFMLLSFQIKPILVFDGRHLPAKALTEDKRRESRHLAKKRAAELMAIGNLEEAKIHIRRSIDITHEMALQLIKECRNMNVDCIVAPYEADAQLAYLNRIDLAQAVVTEDSDLILFGCSKVIFKMDLNGNGILFESSKLPSVMKCPPERYSLERFRQMCILSGCDYLSSLPGIGLAKARQFINATHDPDISNALRKMPSYFNKLNLQMTDEYRENFLKAEATFKHQLVYDPIQRRMVPLTPLDKKTDIKYCCNAGKYLESNIAFQIALGNVDPFTLCKLDSWDPDDPTFKPTGVKTQGWNQLKIAPHISIWNRNYFTLKNEIEMTKNIVKPTENAISVSKNSRFVPKKIKDIQVVENEQQNIQDLKSMYCLQTPKRKRDPSESLEGNESSDSEKKTCDSVDPDVSYTTKISQITLEETSPVLQKNNRTYKRMIENYPRTKLKKISKFERTVIDDSKTVFSKFFDNYTPKEEEICDISQSKFNSEEVFVNINENGNLTSTNTETSSSNLFDNVDENLPELKPICKKALDACDSNLLYLDKIKKDTESNQEYMGDTNSRNNNPFYIDKLENILTPDNSQISEGNASGCLNVMESCKENLSKNTFESKIKNPCRRPGLNRNKSSNKVPHGQQTLLASFGFQKKSQLRH